MRTFKALSIALSLVALSAGVASAQAVSSWNGGCVQLSRTLSYGSSGSDVSSLQRFLVAQNYPGSGGWMITGYFGPATRVAVQDFQGYHGLGQTGVVDSVTASLISQTTCGAAVVNPLNGGSTYAYGTGSSYPYQNWTGSYGNGTYGYGTNGSYPYAALNITSLSANTGYAGSQVTVYGTGFDQYNNTVYFGNVAITGVASNGSSVSFAVPTNVVSGTTWIKVMTSRGTSNALSFTLYDNGSNCSNNYYPYVYGSYGYSQCNCPTQYQYPYAYGYQNSYGNGNYGANGCNNSGSLSSPSISSLSPNSGYVGQQVTVYGSGFSSSGNTVRFGAGILTDVYSQNNGTSLTFTVPSQLSGYGSQYVAAGSYPVSVTNSSGYTTGAVSFAVTGGAGNCSNGNYYGTYNAGNCGYGTATISSVNGPTSASVNQTVTYTIAINNPSSSYVTVTPTWGDSNVYPYAATQAPQTSSSYGQSTLTFTHAYSTTGTFIVSFSVQNGSGTASTAQTTIVVSNNGTNGGSSVAPSIYSVSPTSGPVGTQVTIYGSGFQSYGNVVNFASGAITNVSSSNNGTQLTFTVPSSVGPYCAANQACPQYAQSITPATYYVSVRSSDGTSSSGQLQFTVTQ